MVDAELNKLLGKVLDEIQEEVEEVDPKMKNCNSSSSLITQTCVGVA